VIDPKFVEDRFSIMYFAFLVLSLVVINRHLY